MRNIHTYAINITQNMPKFYPLVPGSLRRFAPRKFRKKSKNDISKKKAEGYARRILIASQRTIDTN